MTAFHQIWALVLVQYRSLWNTLRGEGGRLRLTGSILFGVFWYGAWTLATIGAAAIPNLIGREDIENALGGILLFALAYWQLAPLMTLSLGVSLEMSKVSIYPVSSLTLFSAECLLRLGTGAEMVLLLSGLFAGLVTAGSPHGVALAAALVLFIAFNVFLSAGIRNLIERLFQRRRVREIALIALVGCAILPQVLIWSQTARGFAKGFFLSARGIPYWVHPSGVAGKAAGDSAAWTDWALLSGMVVVAAFFGYRQFLVGYRRVQVGGAEGESMSGRKKVRFTERLLRRLTATLGDPLGALVEKELKYLWRSPRFRLPFFMGFTFGVIAWVPIMRKWHDSFGGWLEQSAITFIALYAFLLLGPVMFLNRFGFDRQSARFYFWLPLEFRELLIAKNLATVVFAAAELVMITTVCALIGLPSGPREILEAALVGSIAMLYLLSVGNHTSVRFPTASNPDRVSRAGMGHGLGAMIQFLLFPLSLTPIVAAFVVRRAGWAEEAFAGILALAAVGGAALYLYTLSRTALIGIRDRESLLAYLTEGGGPVSAE